MNGISIMCDTNPLIYLLDGNKDIAQFLDNKQLYISVITELELFGKQNLSTHDSELIESLIGNCFVIDIEPEIKRIYKEIKQQYTIKLPDAIIAATALYLDLPLLTFDHDFKDVTNIKLMLWER